MVKKLVLFALFLLFGAGTNLHLLSQEQLSDTVWTKELTHVGYIVKSLFSHDNSKVILVTTERIKIFETITGNLIMDFPDVKLKTDQINAMDINPSSDLLATGSISGNVAIWNIFSQDTAIILKHPSGIWDMAFSKDGTKLFVVTDAEGENNIFVWDMNTLKLIKKFGDDGESKLIAISKSSDIFATYSLKMEGEWKHRIKLWDENTLKEIGTIGTHEDDVNALDFSQDGKYLASGGEDTIVKIWDIQKQILFSEFKNNCEYGNDKWAVAIGCFKFSANAEQIVVGDKNAFLSATYIWNKETGDLIYKYNYPSSRDIDVSNDFRFILSCSPKNITLLNAKWTGTDVPNEPVVETVIYPNPNDGNANIEILLENSQFINIEILDISGNTIQALFSGILNQGINNLVWETKNIPSGTYFCKITGSSFNKFIKIIVNK